MEHRIYRIFQQVGNLKHVRVGAFLFRVIILLILCMVKARHVCDVNARLEIQLQLRNQGVYV